MTDAEEEFKNEPSKEEGAAETVTISKQEFEDLVSRLKELENLREKLLHTAADFDNAKKRLAKEREEYVKFSQESLLRSLLPVLDNFERAMAHADLQPGEQVDAAKYKNLLTGIRMVHKQLFDTLKAQGLSRIETVNQVFDPHKHEAVAHIPGEGKEDEIVAEVEAGYMLHDRLLRAAKVHLGASSQPPSGE